jgi:hypothetical protein
MEALVIIGLIGVGLATSNNEDDNNHVATEVNGDVHNPSSDNLYHSDFYDQSQKIVKNRALHNFESSYEDGNKVINNQKINSLGSGFREENAGTDINDLNEVKEGFSDYIYSTSTGEYTHKDDFLKNDQGITAQPFFKSAPPPVDLSDTRQLDRHQGDNRYNQSKREIGNMFAPEKDVGNVYGNTFGEYMGDKTRYNEGLYKTGELPFQQERVANIDVKSNLNREVGQIHADRNNIDNTRVLSNPKLTYQARVVEGKNISENRGLVGEVNHYNPDTFYENSEDRYFTTNGAYLEKSGRPEQIMKDTFRSKFNNQPVGPAAPNHAQGEQRSKLQEPSKMQLINDSNRNVGTDAQYSGNEVARHGYRALPNERQITGERTYESNLATEVSHHTVGVLDDLKGTKKETTLDPKNNGYIANTAINNTLGLLDSVKVTKKQTTIDSKNNGYLKGHEQLTSGFNAPDLTTKDSTLTSYTGSAGADVLGNMSNVNYMHAELNPNKEVISQGREPTLSNTKIVNGPEDIHATSRKLHKDYINYRENGIGRVDEKTPNSINMGDITTMKDKLDDKSLSNRINSELLNPFKENPYTQSLSSFSY